MEQADSASRFAHLVAKLFVQLGYSNVKQNIEFEGSLDHQYEIDILYGVKGDATTVEVKYYRFGSHPGLETLFRAFQHAQFIQKEAGVQRCMLVVSCLLRGIEDLLAKQFPDILVWDVRRVLKEASHFPELLKDFLLVLEIDSATGTQLIGERDELFSDPQVYSRKGEDLGRLLKAIEPGRPMAGHFEDACIASLKYLFENDLFGWHEQQETVDGLQRRDLVCRVLPNSEVWRFLMTDLKSRYVIFEFKNYTDQIRQHEIITTERYLYSTALRNVAIIISPKGCNDSAKKLMRGAMREHGKLIVSITVPEIIKMLEAKDQGSDPNIFLFEVVDYFLMTLGR